MNLTTKRTQALLAFSLTFSDLLSKNKDEVIRDLNKPLKDAVIKASGSLPGTFDKTSERQTAKQYDRLQDLWIDGGNHRFEALSSFVILLLEDVQRQMSSSRARNGLQGVIDCYEGFVDYLDPERDNFDDFVTVEKKACQFLGVQYREKPGLREIEGLVREAAIRKWQGEIIRHGIYRRAA